MSMFPDQQTRPLNYGYADTGEATRRSFFNQVYLWMAVGLIVTAATSMGIAFTPVARNAVFGGTMGPIPLIVMFVGLVGIGWTFNKAAMSLSLTAATAIFMTYCVLMGALISGIWVVYRTETIGAAFLLTGGLFAVMSVIGFTTKADLSKLGTILLMAVIGLILASVVNMFLASSALSWAVTYAAVVIFTGLIAYFTQDLKEKADAYGNDPVLAPKLALIGSFDLYWAFINLFLNLLRILGDRR